MTSGPQLAEAVSAFRNGQLERARQLAEQLVAAGTDATQAHHLLGLVHCRAGEFDAGIKHLRDAAEAEPANPAYRLMLARALVDAGRPAEALAECPPGAEAAAALAFAELRAEAATLLGDSRTAADAWTAVVKARPGDWHAWNNLGNAQAAVGSRDEAIASLRNAARLNPREPGIRRNCSAALASAGRLDEALGELREALKLDPSHLETQLSFASLLVALTHFDEAEQAYRTALQLHPDHAVAVHELGLLLERTGKIEQLRNLVEHARSAGAGGDALAFLEAILALDDGDPQLAMRQLRRTSPDRDPARWHRLMARASDAVGDIELAFRSTKAMNAATADLALWRQRGADYRARLRNMAEVLTPAWAASLEPLAPASDPPIFLVGFPRSGTTLLDTFLMGHPELLVLEEVEMLNAAERVTGSWTGLPRCPAAVLDQAREEYLAVMRDHLPASSSARVVDKLPLNMLGMPLIHCLFPGAPIVFAQRHPCDVVLSALMQSFVLNDGMACFLDLEDAADLYDAAMSLWWRSREILPLNQYTVVYEELVSDPVATLRPLVAFLGLQWRDELLDHQATAEGRGAILTPSYDQVTRPLDRRPSGRWQRYRKQMEPVLPVLLPWAERLGYPE